MIGFFPSFMTNEILYSAVAKFCWLNGVNSAKLNVRTLFGRNVKTIFELSSNLDYFTSKLSHFNIGSSDDIIKQHTLFHYFTSFLTDEKTQLISRYMKGSDGHKIYAQTGLLATNVKLSDNPKMCQKCIESSLINNGIFFIDRLHQIPGVLTCYKHKEEFLFNSNINIRNGNRHEFKFDIKLLEDASNGFSESNPYQQLFQYELNHTEKSFLKSITIKSAWLAQNNIRFELSHFKEVFRHYLKNKNMLTINGSVKSGKLNKLIDSKMSTKVRELLYITSNNIEWAIEILRLSKRKTHPLYYIIMSEILDIEIETLFSLHSQQEILLPCLNLVCNEYHRLIISDYAITADYKTREPILTVKCPTCGFIYSRKQKDTIYTIGRVKEFGEVWMKELATINNNTGISLRAKSRHMGCDPATIKKYS